MNKNSYTILFISLLFVFYYPTFELRLKKTLTSKTQTSKTLTLTSKTLKKYSAFLKKMEESGEISKNREEKYFKRNSSKALQLIKKGIDALLGTSCKVAAKYILYTIGNIEKEEDRHYLKITNDTKTDLDNMKELLKDGYILQVEVLPNHHFVLFLEDGKNLYLMQAFQDIFKLKDWVQDDISSLPMSVDEFFDLFKQALDENNDDMKFRTALLQLFLPHSMWNDDEKVMGLFNWFRWRNYLSIVKVDYVKYDFENSPDKDKHFNQDFHEVDHNFII